MLYRQTMLLGIFCILSTTSVALGQNVEVFKAELKGMEGRLDAKIDGVKNTLDTKIDGAKETLDGKITGTKDKLIVSINGVKSEVVTIKWIIGIASGLFIAFLGFVGHLLHHYVKKVLPNMGHRDSRSRDQFETGQPQRESTSRDEFPDSAQPDYQTAGGKP